MFEIQRIYQLFNMIFLHLVCLVTWFMTVRMRAQSTRLLCNFKSAHFSLSALWKLVQRAAWQLLPVWWGLCGDGVAWWRPLERRAMQLPLVIHLQEGRQWVHLILISPNSFFFKLLFKKKKKRKNLNLRLKVVSNSLLWWASPCSPCQGVWEKAVALRDKHQSAILLWRGFCPENESCH